MLIFMRGQIFSIDFVIAMAILTIVIGVTLQSLDNIQKRVQLMEDLTTNNAEVIAQTFISNSSGFANATPYCFFYSNGTQGPLGLSCAGFKCQKNVVSATRLTVCRRVGPLLETVCTINVLACE